MDTWSPVRIDDYTENDIEIPDYVKDLARAQTEEDMKKSKQRIEKQKRVAKEAAKAAEDTEEGSLLRLHASRQALELARLQADSVPFFSVRESKSLTQYFEFYDRAKNRRFVLVGEFHNVVELTDSESGTIRRMPSKSNYDPERLVQRYLAYRRLERPQNFFIEDAPDYRLDILNGGLKVDEVTKVIVGPEVEDPFRVFHQNMDYAMDILERNGSPAIRTDIRDMSIGEDAARGLYYPKYLYRALDIEDPKATRMRYRANMILLMDIYKSLYDFIDKIKGYIEHSLKDSPVALALFKDYESELGPATKYYSDLISADPGSDLNHVEYQIAKLMAFNRNFVAKVVDYWTLARMLDTENDSLNVAYLGAAHTEFLAKLLMCDPNMELKFFGDPGFTRGLTVPAINTETLMIMYKGFRAYVLDSLPPVLTPKDVKKIHKKVNPNKTEEFFPDKVHESTCIFSDPQVALATARYLGYPIHRRRIRLAGTNVTPFGGPAAGPGGAP